MLVNSKTGIHITWGTRPVLFLVIYCLILFNITVTTAKIAPCPKGNGMKILKTRWERSRWKTYITTVP